jgi:hypothetical protein
MNSDRTSRKRKVVGPADLTAGYVIYLQIQAE